MISLRNILTIAKFESKVIWRNWFFRILCIGVLFFLTMFNIAAFSLADDTPNWFIIANSWGIPYANMILLSIPQAAAIIFLGTGAVKKNKKLDTNEVFFARSISNADYVFGKALALFKLFIGLNVVILSISLIFNLTNPSASFNPLGYVIYPVLSSVPGILFTTGLAFLFVTLIRNQPVSIVLLLGISGVVLIYFQGKHSNIFDYMAFRFTMMASDITGFSDLKFVLLQRAFYFTTGIAFLFATAFFLDRLSNHSRIKLAVGFMSLLLLGVSSYLMVNLWNIRNDKIDLREDMIALNGKWSEKPNIDIISNNIRVEHLGNEISATSRMEVKSNYNKPLKTAYFTLNPALKIQELSVNNEVVDFQRELHIVSIDAQIFKPGQKYEIKIKYLGDIQEEVAHLEVKQKRYDRIDDSFVYPIQKRYAFLQPDYVLLTKDVMWYPDIQIGYSRQSPIKDRSSFIDFQLEVKPIGDNLPISQGEPKKNSEGFYVFKPEHTLPQISLAIGSYEKKELTVDDITYSVYHHPNNDYFSQHFDLIGDTITSLITDIVNEYEFDQKIKYPFPRLQLVEIPIHFRAFTKIYESHQAYIQPEMVLIPEKGGNNRQFDFNVQLIYMDQQSKEENQVIGDKEKQANVFTNFVKKVLTKQISTRHFFDGDDEEDENFSLFPNLYAYNSGIVSRDWALLNKSVSNYLNKDDLSVRDISRNINGISFTEECNELMSNSTLLEIVTKEEDYNKIQKSIALKGEYLFSYLDQVIGKEAFKQFIYDWINTNQHKVSTYEDFSEALRQKFDLDIDPVVKKVFSDTDQPSFVITNTQEYELLDGDRKRYQVIFDVTNIGNNHGVIKVNFNSNSFSESRFFSRRDDDENTLKDQAYLSVINTGQTKQLGFLLDEPPGQISINTLVSQNIPSVISLSTSTFSLKENVTPFEGERIIKSKPQPTQYELIVDNEDPGFSTFSPIKDTYLKEFLDSRNPSDKKYYGIWRRSYSKWLATTGSNFYGQYIRSAHFTRSGKGDKITKWSPELKESGFYDLYVYMMGNNQNSFRGRRNSNRNYTYQYVINHADGKDEITFNVSNAERGWNYLGSYFFNEEGGNVILTDKCDLRSVYADAIKWVKQ